MNTGVDVFDNTIQKTDELLNRIENDMGWSKRHNQSYLALRTVLHALRDRLPIEDATNLSAQFTLLIKGIFFDGWQPNKMPIKMNRDEFVERVSREFFFDIKEDTPTLVAVVINDLFDTIDPSEKIKITQILPDDIVALFY